MTLQLCGIGIPYEKYATIAPTGNRAYERAKLLEEARLKQVSGTDIIGILYTHTEDIDGILRAVAKGCPTDASGYEIDLSKQVEDLNLLIDASQRITHIVRSFLHSEAGQIQWNKGAIVFCDVPMDITELCATLFKLIQRMREAQQPLARQIEQRREVARGHAAQLNPFFCEIFPKEIILIVCCYV